MTVQELRKHLSAYRNECEVKIVNTDDWESPAQTIHEVMCVTEWVEDLDHDEAEYVAYEELRLKDDQVLILTT